MLVTSRSMSPLEAAALSGICDMVSVFLGMVWVRPDRVSMLQQKDSTARRYRDENGLMSSPRSLGKEGT